jgi:hypothetical protein
LDAEAIDMAVLAVGGLVPAPAPATGPLTSPIVQ